MAYPILAPKDTWYTQGGTTIKRNTITEINIKDSYTPAGAVTAQWDGSAAKDGSITVYIEGTKLTIAGNGSGKIKLNSDSTFLFCDTGRKDFYTNALTLNGLDVFDPSEVISFRSAFTYANFDTIDVSDWNSKSCTTFNRMFSACGAKHIIVRGMNFSECTDASHMFADCSKITEIDVSTFDTTSCTNMSAMFNDCHSLKTIDLSNWETSKVLVFSQMFERCNSLKEIIGLENWNTSAAGTIMVPKQGAFAEMFSGCSSLRKLNLSSFDSSHAYEVWANAMENMFLGMSALEEITLGIKFTRTGANANPEKVPPFPTPTIPGWDGNWYTSNRMAYAPTDIPNNIAATYYATQTLADDSIQTIKSGTLNNIGDAIRQKKGGTAKIGPTAMPDQIVSITTYKPEQQKTVTVVNTSQIAVAPDPGKVLSKVTVAVDIPKWIGGKY